MNNYLATFNVTRGEYSFRCYMTLQARNEESAGKKAQRLASAFYSDRAVKPDEGGTYYFNGGEIAVEVRNVQFILPGDAATLHQLGIV